MREKEIKKAMYAAEPSHEKMVYALEDIAVSLSNKVYELEHRVDNLTQYIDSNLIKEKKNVL